MRHLSTFAARLRTAKSFAFLVALIVVCSPQVQSQQPERGRPQQAACRLDAEIQDGMEINAGRMRGCINSLTRPGANAFWTRDRRTLEARNGSAPEATVQAFTMPDLVGAGWMEPGTYDRGWLVARIESNGAYEPLGLRGAEWEHLVWIKRTSADSGILYVLPYRQDGGPMEIGRMQAVMRISREAHEGEEVPAAARWVTIDEGGRGSLERIGNAMHRGSSPPIPEAVIDAIRELRGDGLWVRCGSGCCTGTMIK